MVRTLGDYFNSLNDEERTLWLETLTDDELEALWTELQDRELYPEKFVIRVED